MDDQKSALTGHQSPHKTRRTSQKAHTVVHLFQCQTCMEFFSSNEKLNAHMDKHASNKKLFHEDSGSEVITRLLENESSSPESMDIYETKENLGRKAKKKRGSGRVICDICKESFVNDHVLRVHMRRHTGERPYLCTLCQSTFTQKSALVGHMTTHANEEHACPECEQVFTQERTLKKHMKFHTGEVQMKRVKKHQEFRVKIPTKTIGEVRYENRYQCDICEKQFITGSLLEVHRRVHTNERPFECGVCGQRFKQKITLLDHESIHRTDRPYECEKCGSKYKQIRILRQHMKSGSCERKLKKKLKRKNADSKQMQTNVQNSIASSDTNLPSIAEVEEDNDEEDQNGLPKDESESDTGQVGDKDNNKAGFGCAKCAKVFSAKRYLSQHMKTHSDEKPYVCNVCNKGFRLKAMMREHMETHAEGKHHTCQTCQKQFKTQRCLQKHIGRNICTGIRPYICAVCNKSFMYARFLESHRCLNAPKKVFDCKLCGRTFTRRNLLTEHVRTHTGERPLKCDVCGKTFAKRALLRNHSFTHSGDKKHECSICGKKFTTRTNLKTHMNVHSAEKNYPCNQCHKAFKQASSLHVHMKSVHRQDAQGNVPPRAYLCAHCGKMFRYLRWMMKHQCPAIEGTKRFQCELCQKMFDKKQQLEVHIRTHTGARPYECSECGKRFTQSGSLKDHMVTHTGEKIHACNLCDAKFTRMNSLRRHKLIIHVGVEPFMCGRCGLTFKYQKSLKKHENVCTENQGQENFEVVPKIAQEIPLVPGPGESAAALEQHMHENILGNIKRAMNEAGIEIKDNIQYQIVVGENAGELTVHIGGNTQ